MVHLKRLNMPKTWPLARKGSQYIVRPKPCSHQLELSLPLSIVLKDLLKYAKTKKEINWILHHKEVLVNQRRRKEPDFSLTLFDTLAFPEIKEYYRLSLSEKNKFYLVRIGQEESQTKIMKVIGKTIQKKNKIQLNLNDGTNLLTEQKEIKAGDSLLVSLPDLKIISHFPFREDFFVFLIGGKHSGQTGQLAKTKGKEIIYKNKKGEEITTLKKYALILGEEKTKITV